MVRNGPPGPQTEGEDMKRFISITFVGVMVLSMAGCVTPYGRPDYTASGMLAGAATGAMIGSTAHDSGEGALVGGLIGAVAGGLIGNAMDQEEAARSNAQTAPSPGEPVVVTPAPGCVWIPGVWTWYGWHRVWAPGHWHRRR